MAAEVGAHRIAAIGGAIALLAALLACCVTAGAARAGDWTVRRLTGEAAKVTMFGMSCPAPSLCVAVGGNNSIASSTDPKGAASDWGVVYAGDGAQPTGPGSVFGGRQVRGVSCPSTGLCVAVTFEGDVYTATNPTGPASAWQVTDIDGGGPNTHRSGVSCPSTSLCVAVSQDGKIATSTNPTGGESAWSTVALPGLRLRGVSCASSSLCVAVGGEVVGDGFPSEQTVLSKIVSSTDPTGGTEAWQVQAAVGAGDLFGVSCTLLPLCVTGNTAGRLAVSTDPTSATPNWDVFDGGGMVQITAVSCLSASRCVAVDNNGDVLASTDPTGGPGAWSFDNVIPYVDEENKTHRNAMFGLSCPAVTLCAAGGTYGHVLTSANPFAESTDQAKKGRKKRRRPKRPRTTIALAPLHDLRAQPGGLKVMFRFFARHRVKVDGFVCKLDRRPLKRCRSPKRYRHIGLGRHVFRVRAIGWTGLKGPAATSRFVVHRIWPPPPR